VATIFVISLDLNGAQSWGAGYLNPDEAYKPWATFVVSVFWFVPFLVVACLQRTTTVARWQVVMAMLASAFVVVALFEPLILGLWALAGCGIAFLVFAISELIRALFFPAKAPVEPEPADSK
ncbi:MAG: hypothetical protein NTY61_00975, partial [Candidatus Parcubacteria bacterium]|nr:hypothetical protein [Candidatus Parcubacteria bacterium]